MGFRFFPSRVGCGFSKTNVYKKSFFPSRMGFRFFPSRMDFRFSKTNVYRRSFFPSRVGFGFFLFKKPKAKTIEGDRFLPKNVFWKIIFPSRVGFWFLKSEGLQKTRTLWKNHFLQKTFFPSRMGFRFFPSRAGFGFSKTNVYKKSFFHRELVFGFFQREWKKMFFGGAGQFFKNLPPSSLF